MEHSRENRAILYLAFVDSLPVLMGYSTMGFVAGVLLAAKGNVVLSPLWGLLSSTLWVTGTMSIAGVQPIAARIPVYAFALMTLAIHGVMTAPPRIAMIMPGPPSLKHFGSSPPSAMP